MNLPKLVPIVEGDGEYKAVPILLRRLLWEKHERYNVLIPEPKNTRGVHRLIKDFEIFLQYAYNEQNCAAILVLLDVDETEDCPIKIATDLAKRAQKRNLPVPIGIVCAKREYEAWFLASLETIAGNASTGLPAGLKYSGDIEEKRGVKEWLTKQMPQGRAYKPIEDQAAMTELIDFNLALQNSRSFRRLDHALDQLLAAIDSQQTIVTPLLSDHP